MDYAQYPTPVWMKPRIWKTKPSWWKDTIIRDNYCCKDCKNGKERLLVHHIDETGEKPIKLINNNLQNLVALCHKCHAKRHGRGVKIAPITAKLKEYAPDRKLKNKTLTLIAKEVGCSKERVRQVAEVLEYQSVRKTQTEQRTRHCLVCEKEYRSYYGKKFCSPSCASIDREQRYWTIIPCKNCGFYFKVSKKGLRNRGRYYCSKTCQGKWIGKEYGFNTPNNYWKNQKLHPDCKRIALDFPDSFTVQEFASKYGYKSKVGAGNAISNLKIQNKVEDYRVRGLYRIKDKATVDK